MSYPRKHRWFHRMALGLALASVMFAGRASVASAKIDPGHAPWAYDPAAIGNVDLDVGYPAVGGDPARRPRSAGGRAACVPYLSHGVLTQDSGRQAAQAGDDLSERACPARRSLDGPGGRPRRGPHSSPRTRAPRPTRRRTSSGCGGSGRTGTDRHRQRCESGLARARFRVGRSSPFPLGPYPLIADFGDGPSCPRSAGSRNGACGMTGC